MRRRDAEGDTRMSAMPKRIQRKRTKGWKMPPGVIYVGRPTKWGNPYKVSRYCTDRNAVALYWNSLSDSRKEEIRRELRGKDLACWCAIEKPCHADVLL